jgi:hypothetical protein
MANNVQLVRRLADGGMPCPVPIVKRSGCFCTRGAMQDYDFVLYILALAKTRDKSGQAVTPGGSAPDVSVRGRRAGFCPAASAAK